MKQPTALTPKLRFPGFTDPWAHEPLSKVLTEHKIKNNAGRDVFSVSMEFGIVNQIELLGRSFAAADTSHYTIGRRYDVVYTKSPLKAFPFGIVKQSKFDGEVALSPLYGVFTPSNPHVGLMIEAYFESPNRSKAFLSPLCQKGAKNTLQITNATFLSGRLPLPTKPAEQQKIAECLSTLDELIGAESQKLDALKAHKKGLMQQLFPREGETLPRLRFPEFHSAPEWEEALLGDYFDPIRNGFVGTATPYYVASGGIKYLQGRNIQEGRIEDDSLVRISEEFHARQRKSHLKIGDLLMVQSGHVGECAVVDSRFSGANCHALVILTPKRTLSSAFFVFYFYSPIGERAIFQITTGNTIKHILASELKTLKVVLPSLAEQHRIATCLSSLDELIAAQSDRLSALQTHKQGLLQQLFPSPVEANA